MKKSVFQKDIFGDEKEIKPKRKPRGSSFNERLYAEVRTLIDAFGLENLYKFDVASTTETFLAVRKLKMLVAERETEKTRKKTKGVYKHNG